MRQLCRILTVVIVCMLVAAPRASFAWGNKGHMMVAAAAWNRMSPEAQARATALLKLNPFHPVWLAMAKAAQVPAGARDEAIFAIAATWPDQIKGRSKLPVLPPVKFRHYTADGTDNGDRPLSGPVSSQNVGYDDLNMHKYWHFVDTPFGANGLTLPDIPVPNAHDRIDLFMKTLGSNAPDPLKSYDLAWLLHLVGDVHQPLHVTTRVTRGSPDGDHGGNLVIFCPLSGCDPNVKRKPELHGFWDDVVGSGDVAMAIRAADSLPAPDAHRAALMDVDTWVKEGFALAQTEVYHSPVGRANGPYTQTVKYRTNARSVADAQIALAAARLASILDSVLR